MWQVSKKYAFVPSGDADELILQVVSVAPLSVAKDWYENTYIRPFNLKRAFRAYKVKLLNNGRDGSLKHNQGDTYYVFDSDYHNAREITNQFLTASEKAKILYNARGGYIV